MSSVNCCHAAIAQWSEHRAWPEYVRIIGMPSAALFRGRPEFRVLLPPSQGDMLSHRAGPGNPRMFAFPSEHHGTLDRI
jgi:hypothetical protein